MECRLISVDPTVMAGSLSAVAGVLAGLVFAGIVVLLGGTNDRAGRIRATMPLVGGLFAMVVASVFFAIISGESICPRALGLQAVAVSLLGVGATAIFGGIAMLVHAHDDLGYAARLTNLGSLIVGIFVLFYAVLAPQNFGAEMTASGVVSFQRTWFSPVYTNLQEITAGLVLVAVVVRAVATKMRGRPEGSHPLVIVAAYTSVLYIAVAALAGWFLLGFPATDWTPGSTVSGELVRTFCYAIATSAAVAIGLQLVALPLSRHRAPSPAGSGMEPAIETAATRR